MAKQSRFSFAEMVRELGRWFDWLKREARNPVEWRALDQEQREGEQRLLNKMIQGDDDGEWFHRRF
jgi:hypothetical protein